MTLRQEYDAILARVYNAVGDILLDDVTPRAKDIISRSVHDNVYNVYDAATPRRKDNGGLSDTDNYEEFLVRPTNIHGDGTFTLLIMNQTPFQEDNQLGMSGILQGSNLLSLAEVVEQGETEFNMPFARPFTERAEKEIYESLEHLISSGLKKRGL